MNSRKLICVHKIPFLNKFRTILPPSFGELSVTANFVERTCVCSALVSAARIIILATPKAYVRNATYRQNKYISPFDNSELELTALCSAKSVVPSQNKKKPSEILPFERQFQEQFARSFTCGTTMAGEGQRTSNHKQSTTPHRLIDDEDTRWETCWIAY